MPASEQPGEHVPVTNAKVGVLIANLGTPDGYDYWSMRRYLNEFLSDKMVIDYPSWKWQPILQSIILTKRPFSSGAAYKSIWNEDENESPLLSITKSQTEKLRQRLKATYGDQIRVDFCMRYGNPSTRSKVQAMIDAGCDKVLFFPLYPQYAGATTATANKAFFDALETEAGHPSARTVPPYYNDPRYIDALTGSVKKAYAELPARPDHLVASYHGMPERYVAQGDPYFQQCLMTSQLLGKNLGWDEAGITTAFQSRFGPEEWIKPYTVDEVARLAKTGKRNIAVVAPAFSSDCVETLEEINSEIKDAFLKAGGKEFTYIPCLNDSSAHMNALTGIISDNLNGWAK